MMMSLADVIVNYVREELLFGCGSIGLDSNLAEDVDMDSTAMVELILWVGDKFNIDVRIADFTPENFGTPRKIVEFVEQHARPINCFLSDVTAEMAGND